jgi:N-acetyl-anhydromuramyl-L-alanine amidase AmpD
MDGLEVLQRPSPNRGGPRAYTDGIIVHSTRGAAQTYDQELIATLRWFSTPASQTSAHYVIAFDGRVYECVPPDLIAWHAREHNARWLGIELVQPRIDMPFSDAQYISLARLAKHLSARYGFPLDRTTLRGHEEMPAGKRDGKTDPGPRFDWQRFMSLIKELDAMDEAKVKIDEALALYDRMMAELQVYWSSSALDIASGKVADRITAVARLAGDVRRALLAAKHSVSA